ncbi:uncharacterized protein LACBIDRAFT_321150 [Laccaria bicolor S238N-H82]|uniref:Predicted protein n=1 Tax=Laccaria bicolor (strain S238N-H82 / ATCC MYA-4686) TaxID=486041 RepID=B0CNX5_LACBS|nr:uncharacterized protein LACBIDRAFT_321150 [Laccaria bicolor S238N-H82]EDR15369.1 predicted protein [Laccaria bicolor S238N-H82]|eukprot:XP_001873577.1 predicted protein [Laccaria bicolor S238N-H82]
MDEQDLATLNLVNIPSDLLAEPYQDLPFEGVGVDELLEGRSDVLKRAPYCPYFHDIWVATPCGSVSPGAIHQNIQRGVWKSAFHLYDDLPTCPQDVSEPQWSSLLFGPDTCDCLEVQSQDCKKTATGPDQDRNWTGPRLQKTRPAVLVFQI